MPAPVPDGLPSELLERRPDLVAAERRVAAAFHLIQAAEAARLPRIALTAGGGRSTSELLRLAGVGAGFWRAGIDMLAPIFTGGALQAQVEIATAEQQAALALYGQAALRAFSEVESSLASEQLLADQQRYLESVLAQDTEALRLGRLRYDAGATDLLHVLQLQARQLDYAVRSDRHSQRSAGQPRGACTWRSAAGSRRPGALDGHGHIMALVAFSPSRSGSQEDLQPVRAARRQAVVVLQRARGRRCRRRA